ncbi:MAG TPA: alkyl hydroperoxide reductase [Kofleriaceae bacterium]|nr:alkyl hydroperoxide reductase [Kofleriaceae bacterium]
MRRVRLLEVSLAAAFIASGCGDDIDPDGATCGAGTHLVDGACVPDGTLECGDGTIEVEGECVSPWLEPGTFRSPVTQLQRLAGLNDHMHLDEVRFVAANQRLYVCSYDFAVVNVADPGGMRYIAQQLKVVWPEGEGFRDRYPLTGTRTGGCINLAVDGEWVFTTHRGNIDDPAYLGGWRLAPGSSPGSVVPSQIPLHAEEDTSFEGIDVGNGHIYVGLGVGGFAVYDFDTETRTFTRRGSLGGMNHILGLRVVGNTVYAADGLGGVVAIDVTDPDAPALIGRVATGGQARDVRVDAREDRTTVYVAAAAAGLVVVDATDAAQMRVIGQVSMPGSAQRLDYSGDRVFVAAWNDARVYDVSDPTTPTFVGAARMTRRLPGTTGEPEDDRPDVTSRTLGIAASSLDPDIMFAGNWHVPYSFRVHSDRAAPFIYLPEDVNLVDFGPTEQGATSTRKLLVRNEGTEPLTLYSIWSSSSSFTTDVPQLRVPAQSSAILTVTYTASSEEKETAILHLGSDDPAQPLRKAYLVGNQEGLGVGKPLPETIVALTSGDEWSSTASENAGKVQMLAYFATF